jgi:DNA-binding beta-propeller fold protein YncE
MRGAIAISRFMPGALAKLFALMLCLLVVTSCSASAQTFDPRDPRSPLHLIRVIELPGVRGRIDHMALAAHGKRLLVAENGNGSVDDVDLVSGKVVGRISGLHEPQGVAWLPSQREIAVASGDGLVTFYRGTDRRQVAVLSLGADADNVRVDRRNGHLVVGYGSGGLAVIDPATRHVIGRVGLPAHPEAFELLGAKVIVNVPDAHKIAVADLDQGKVVSTLGTGLFFGNFPMASDPTGSRVAVAYRTPATVSILDSHSGATISSARTCGDADDLYFRARQLIIVCGSGAVELTDQAMHDIRISTQRGARTGVLDPISGHLFIAVPSRQSSAAIWELSFL